MYLFVYGSLKLGNRNRTARRLHALGAFVGRAEVRASLVQFGPYPGALPGNRRVPGELFRIPKSLLRSLNSYEGPNYKLRQVMARTSEGRSLRVWVYFLNATV